jgi:[CysO sulfur-carrier protein]-S-L-cysteine hydrolase
MSEPLVIPRRLAIRILHAAQIAQPMPIRAMVTAKDGIPDGLRSDGERLEQGEAIWARLWSYPQAEAVPDAAELDAAVPNLVVSLNTRGVLQMRAWCLVDDRAREQVLKIRD